MADAAAEVVTAFYAAYAGRDARAAAALYADGGTHEEIATGKSSAGRSEIEQGLASFLGAFPDAEWETGEPFLREDGAAIPYTLRGTLAGRLGPFEGAGQRLELRGVHILEIRNGQITSSADYWDGSTFARQMRGGPPTEGAT